MIPVHAHDLDIPLGRLHFAQCVTEYHDFFTNSYPAIDTNNVNIKIITWRICREKLHKQDRDAFNTYEEK